MTRSEVAEGVNAKLHELHPDRKDLQYHTVDSRWVGKLERGDTRWCSDLRRAALRAFYGVTTDADLDLYPHRRTDTPSPANGNPDQEAATAPPQQASKTIPLDTAALPYDPSRSAADPDRHTTRQAEVARFLDGDRPTDSGDDVLAGRPGQPHTNPISTDGLGSFEVTGWPAAPLAGSGIGSATFGSPVTAATASLSKTYLWGLASESVELVSELDTGSARSTLALARAYFREAAADYVTTSDLPAALRAALAVQKILAHIRGSGGLSVSHTRELYVLQAASFLLLASASHDFGEPAAGMMHAETAAVFADRAEHPELIGWVNCTKAMIDLWRDRPEAVLEHARHDSGNRSDSHRLRGLRVRALAQLGRHTEAIEQQLMLESDRCAAISASELEDLGAIFTFPAGRRNYYSAVTYSLLGDCTTAEAYVRELGYGDTPPTGTHAWPISWALSRSYLALARIGSPADDGGPEAAAAALAPVLALTEGQRISQLAQVFAALANRLSDSRFRGNPAATDLREQTRNFLGTTVQRKAMLS
ncbi:hypothetical protein [Micromonospora sp. WMMD1082]|uniref:hypothetical protein n=1 Tax=Micromonospora sp. WMMD1082 TaxID=3016104 RepID=UPI002417A2E1|nr:hypothetical protein [Micromonospora sp. WMMD1082]MDG4795499.1 hypothetical protein [Micromonospora sp. WMMD1082]